MFNFIKNVVSFLWTGADVFRKVLHLLIMLFVFSIIVSALSSTSPVIPASAALIIHPAGRLVEEHAGDPFDRAIAELMGEEDPQTRVQDVVDGLERAKDDSRISSVLLDLSAMPGGGMSKLKRIADAIVDFRESGKPVIATADFFSQSNYYLAAHADEIYMHPDGMVTIQGFGAYQNYYKQALDKLLVDWNVFRVGTYKSAVEPYLRNDMSDADRQALAHVIDQLWQRYTADVEAARELEPGTIEAVLSSFTASLDSFDGDFARAALEFGIVDGLWTRKQIVDRMIEVAGKNGDESPFPVTSLGEYLAEAELLNGDGSAEENIGIVVAAGEIMNGSQPPGAVGGESTARMLREARKDKSVKAVVLRVDSPGGSTFASQVIKDEVDELRAAGKPVVVSMSSVAASGGYWISMSADRIFATPYTITGSIGIFGMFPTFQRSLAALGISTDGVGSTILAGQPRPDREMSDEMKQIFQLSINHGYDQFITGVADYRGISKEAVDSIAQGRIWTGDDAMANGLIDEFGELDAAIMAAAELAELEEDDYGTRYFERKLEPAEQLVLELLGGAQSWGLDFTRFAKPRPAIDQVANFVEHALSPLTRFNDPKGIYSHCFCVFE